jgi:hypothetical protein
MLEKMQLLRLLGMRKMKRGFALVLFLMAFFLVLVACAPKQTAKNVSEGTAEETQEFGFPAWAETSDCESCHEIEVASARESARIY